MKRKILKILSGLTYVMLSIVMVLSLGGAIIVAAGYFVEGLTPISYAYLFIGDIILSIEQLMYRDMGVFPPETLNIVIMAVGFGLALVCIICMVLFAKALKNKSGIKRKILIPSLLIQLVLSGVFILNAVILYFRAESFNYFINSKLEGFSKIIVQNIGKEFVTIKGMVIGCVLGVLLLLMFVMYIVCRGKVKKEKKYVSLNFYTEEFIKEPEKKKIEEKTKTAERSNPTVALKQKTKKQSQELINRIMQLNALRDSGQISDVEYTKLRQKVIKRYRV